ncbi:MAG: hypothetical protein HY563_09080 [Ignavibacteriales bacterium]|nr:hypothetical protein [Ignavibacteriales bacterium]
MYATVPSVAPVLVSFVRPASERGQISLFQGAAYVELGLFDKAAQYFAGSLSDFKDPSEAGCDYALIYRYIALNRIGADEEANKLLRERLKKPKGKEWIGSIGSR